MDNLAGQISTIILWNKGTKVETKKIETETKKIQKRERNREWRLFHWKLFLLSSSHPWYKMELGIFIVSSSWPSVGSAPNLLLLGPTHSLPLPLWTPQTRWLPMYRKSITFHICSLHLPLYSLYFTQLLTPSLSYIHKHLNPFFLKPLPCFNVNFDIRKKTKHLTFPCLAVDYSINSINNGRQ